MDTSIQKITSNQTVFRRINLLGHSSSQPLRGTPHEQYLDSSLVIMKQEQRTWSQPLGTLYTKSWR